ncbi:MAG: hypothetical protein QOE61_2886, partial [Micromonosporaceae bacterium]|nr:hypothetical protein [Micromonosporaceae bacterium]
MLAGPLVATDVTGVLGQPVDLLRAEYVGTGGAPQHLYAGAEPGERGLAVEAVEHLLQYFGDEGPFDAKVRIGLAASGERVGEAVGDVAAGQAAEEIDLEAVHRQVDPAGGHGPGLGDADQVAGHVLPGEVEDGDATTDGERGCAGGHQEAGPAVALRVAAKHVDATGILGGQHGIPLWAVRLALLGVPDRLLVLPDRDVPCGQGLLVAPALRGPEFLMGALERMQGTGRGGDAAHRPQDAEREQARDDQHHA